MSKLYEEAIAEAKQLRELAEQNAKNAIVEAVTPRIREFIEEQLLAEEESDLELEYTKPKDEDDAEVSEQEDHNEMLEDVVNEIMAEIELNEKEEEVLLDDKDSESDDEEEVELDEEALTVLSKMLNERSDLTEEEQKLKNIVLSMHTLRSKLSSMNEEQRQEAQKIIKKVKNQILTNEVNMTTDDNMLEVDLGVTEVTTSEVADSDTVEDALNELRLMLDLGEPDEDGEFDVEDMSIDLADEADEEEKAEDEAEEDSEELTSLSDLDDEELDFELEDDEGEDLTSDEESDEPSLEEEMLEINEEELVSALREMKVARESLRTQNTNTTNESAEIATLRGKVAEYAKVVESLREQLTEMNLFNAKLLYVNKLVQDKNVSPEQRRGIVESLDGAKTLREVKLLYKGLTKSLKTTNSSSKKGQISESTARRSIGSSSRPVGTQSTQKSHNESSDSASNRWATLAGLK